MTDREQQIRDRIAGDPSDAEALRELAEHVGAKRDRKDEAVELWRRYVEVVDAGETSQALFRLANAQVQARRDPEAIEVLERCTQIAPEYAEAFDLLGELLRRAGELEGAIVTLQRAAELDPEAVRPRVALVACFDALGRQREAGAVLESIRKLGADNPALMALVQELMHRRG